MQVKISPDTRPDGGDTVDHMAIMAWYYVHLRGKWTLCVKLPTDNGKHSIWFPEEGTWTSVGKTDDSGNQYGKMAARRVPAGTDILFKI